MQSGIMASISSTRRLPLISPVGSYLQWRMAQANGDSENVLDCIKGSSRKTNCWKWLGGSSNPSWHLISSGISCGCNILSFSFFRFFGGENFFEQIDGNV